MISILALSRNMLLSVEQNTWDTPTSWPWAIGDLPKQMVQIAGILSAALLGGHFAACRSSSVAFDLDSLFLTLSKALQIEPNKESQYHYSEPFALSEMSTLTATMLLSCSPATTISYHPSTNHSPSPNRQSISKSNRTRSISIAFSVHKSRIRLKSSAS